MQNAFFTFEGTEYRFEDKAPDWYWALGIIATATAIAAVLFNNILLAFLIIVAAGSIAIHAAKHPRIHRFTITSDGIAIDSNFYAFKDMLSFSVLEYADETLPPSLSIKTKHFLAPHLLIPLVGQDPVAIFEFMHAHVPEGRHEHSPIDRLVELFRL